MPVFLKILKRHLWGMYSSMVALPPKLEATKMNANKMMIYIITLGLHTITWL